MTSEKRILISPTDILSVGFECSHCGATYFVPVKRLDRNLPRECQNCQESFVTDAPVQNKEHSDLVVLRSFIKLFKDMQSRKFVSSVRFEIQDESPSAEQKPKDKP